MGAFAGGGESSGQWWVPVPNQIDGKPPPAGTPNRLVNVGNGAKYLFGTYYANNETFVPYAPGGKPKVTSLERAHGSWWGASGGTDNNGRMMTIGWATPDYHGPAGPGIDILTRLTLLREVNYDVKIGDLVSNPVPEITKLRAAKLASEKGVPLSANLHHIGGTGGGAASSADVEIIFSDFADGAEFGACVLGNERGQVLGISIRVSVELPSATTFMEETDMPGNDYNVTHYPANTDPKQCQAACAADTQCKAWTYVIRGSPAGSGDCCLKSSVSCPHTTSSAAAKCTSGAKVKTDLPSCGPSINRVASASVDTCEQTMRTSSHLGNSTFQLLTDESELKVRILPDRSLADFFVHGGRWSGTHAWASKTPRAAGDSTVSVWSKADGVKADVDVWAMSCGWLNPSYTENPTL